jgi:uncharacterized repeat protein (TIGR03806 family)
MRTTIALTLAAALLAACGGSSSSGTTPPPPPPPPPASTDLTSCTAPGTTDYLAALPPKLSNLCLMVPQNGQVTAKAGVVPYELNTPLFSDYALKTRMIWSPPGVKVAYDATRPLDLPVGAILAKSFAFAPDLRTPAVGTRLVETRILVHAADGWKGATYKWSADQKDADLLPGGEVQDIAFIDPSGTRQVANYLLPSVNQCSRCHDTASEGKNRLIGPTVRNLNRTWDYGAGPVNQLTHLAAVGLTDASWPADPATMPVLPKWDDPADTLDHRARAWLEVNCAHCHSPTGLASPYGLNLLYNTHDPLTTPEWVAIGVCKDPVAAGAGAGGRPYDIIPANPGNSILTYRLDSTVPAVAMPQVGRSVVHAESLQLITDWITSMPLPSGLNCR